MGCKDRKKEAEVMHLAASQKTGKAYSLKNLDANRISGHFGKGTRRGGSNKPTV